MPRSEIFSSSTYQESLSEKGTGDGLFRLSPPCQKKIREEEGRELIGRDRERPVSPVPRPLVPDDAYARGFAKFRADFCAQPLSASELDRRERVRASCFDPWDDCA